MRNIFTEHPRSIGESYFQHLRFACHIGFTMVVGGLTLIIHAFLPFLFLNTGSNRLFNLMNKVVQRMPKAENRVIHLSQTIEKKIKSA